MRTVLLGAGVLLAALGVIYWLRGRFVAITVEGNSMEPVLYGEDRVLVRRLPASRLRNGQIIVLERPYRQDRWEWRPITGGLGDRGWLVKRLVALPGDTIPEGIPADPHAVVPPGYAVVRGDNPDASIDSRMFGLVPLDRVLGVVLRRFGPEGSQRAYARIYRNTYAEDGLSNTGRRGPDLSSSASRRANRGVR